MVRATIRDVAKQAGVSVATVSRALNGSGIVKSGTRRRVLEVMADLGFNPNAAARRLSLGRTLTITVLVSYLTRPQTVERLHGVDEVLSDSEFDLVVYNVERVEKRDHYLRTLPSPQRTDGLLVISLPPRPDDLPRIAAADVPVVFIDTHTPGLEAFSQVIGDDVAGGELATRHLIELGHRHIGFIGDAFDNPFGFTSSRDRHAGYTRALEAAGTAPRANWIGLGAHGRYEARTLATRILSQPKRPTAIFASSDTQALGVMAAAREVGLRVPDQLSVIGYDDIEAAEYVGLTTVRQNLFETGRRGAALLLREIGARPQKPTAIEVPPELVIRGTTAPPTDAVDLGG